MNLIIDIGNTAGKYYLFEGGELYSHGHELGHELKFLDKIGCEADAAIVSSVVDLPTVAEARLQQLPCPILRFSAAVSIPLTNRYCTPLTLGADRLAAAVGAWTRCPSQPLLIIDAGSCITFDFVSAEGAYMGGNIAPGLHARLRAIGDFFPRLPLVEAEGETPDLGFDTETAIRAGVIQGMRHEIEGYIDHFKRKYPSLLVFLTGGDEIHFADTIKNPIFADQILVPRGLNHILEFNKTKITTRQ